MFKRFVAPALLAFALPIMGCYATLPPPFAEGTDVLGPGKVGFTFAGAGAGGVTSLPQGTSTTTTGGGFEARLRVGVGAKSEVGASAMAAIGTNSGGGDPPFFAGGKLTYKVAPISWLAFVADAGVLDANAASIAIFGGDLAVILAPYTAQNGSQIYTGLRGGFAIPVLQNQNLHAASESFTVPIGYALHANEHVRLFFEAGFVVGLSQQFIEVSPAATNNFTTFGGYGLVGVGYLF